MNEHPTTEQMAALRKYAAENGRTWKSQLLTEWERGTATGALQQVRNAFGPTWLVRFRFPLPAGIHAHDTDGNSGRCLSCGEYA